jgi:hypothetical protein
VQAWTSLKHYASAPPSVNTVAFISWDHRALCCECFAFDSWFGKAEDWTKGFHAAGIVPRDSERPSGLALRSTVGLCDALFQPKDSGRIAM